MNEHMVQDFGVLLSQLSDGELRDEINETVADIVSTLFARAQLTNGPSKGTLVLKVEFKVEPNGLTNILGDVESKLPKPIRSVDHFYTSKDGGFSRNNPRQMALPIREVVDAPPAVREVSSYDSKSGEVTVNDSGL